MRTNEIFAMNGVEKMTNKDMFVFGINYIANKHNVKAEFIFDVEMVTLPLEALNWELIELIG